MVRRVYVDTAWKSKLHTCYDPVEDRFFEVEDLAELAEKYNKVYIDNTIFPRMWPQLKALIDNGVKVFYFTRPWTWRRWREKYAKELKERFGRKKTDYGDAYILSRIHEYKPRLFKEITPLDVEFKPLLMKERRASKVLMGLRRMRMLGIDVENEIKNHEEWLKKVRGEIVENAMEKIPGFMEIAEELGLNSNDINALSALAGLLIYLRWPYEVSSFHRAKRLLGLYKPTREEVRRFEERSGEKYRKRYNGYARRYLVLLTATILRKERNAFPPKAKDEKRMLRRLLSILRTYGDGADAGGGRIKALMSCGRPIRCSDGGVVKTVDAAKGCPDAPPDTTPFSLFKFHSSLHSQGV
ncbi:MAG: hypothetical protein QXX29_00605 [Nitrososphaerota archaeon]